MKDEWRRGSAEASATPRSAANSRKDLGGAVARRVVEDETCMRSR
jgi:hypothetical protein